MSVPTSDAAGVAMLKTPSGSLGPIMGVEALEILMARPPGVLLTLPPLTGGGGLMPRISATELLAEEIVLGERSDCASILLTSSINNVRLCLSSDSCLSASARAASTAA